MKINLRCYTEVKLARRSRARVTWHRIRRDASLRPLSQTRMSARQAFVPQRPQSSVPFTGKSVPDEGRVRGSALPHSTGMTNLARQNSSVESGPTESGRGREANAGDAAAVSTSSGGGTKARSLVGLLGKRVPRPPPNTHIPVHSEEEATSRMRQPRRSFDGIRRPEMTPLSLVPYPADVAPTGGVEGSSVPRNLPFVGFASARGTVAGQIEENSSKEDGVRERRDNENNGNFTGEVAPEYMRLSGAGPGLARATVGGNVNTTGKNAVALTLAAPVPGYAHFDPGEIEGTMNENVGDLGNGDVARIASMPEGQRIMHPAPGLSDERESRTFANHHQEERRPQKRTRRAIDEDYTVFSSPQMPPTPVPVGPPPRHDSLTTLEALFMDLGELLNESEFETECKRWRECTREEWLRGSEELSKEFQDLVDLAKDHFTGQMLSYSSLSKAVADRRAELDRDMQIMNDGMKVLGKNLACLAQTSKARCP
ncbi:hypothetical protein EDD17DRAFT_1553402 [Pisolithus thermaeus]|nr:hypothetical protein EDD17DRAFT_1553402 [Pisolithus thermaeus]